MQSEQGSLSVIYCLWSEALGFGVILESVQNFLVHGECALVLAQSLQDCQHGEALMSLDGGAFQLERTALAATLSNHDLQVDILSYM